MRNLENVSKVQLQYEKKTTGTTQDENKQGYVD